MWRLLQLTGLQTFTSSGTQNQVVARRTDFHNDLERWKWCYTTAQADHGRRKSVELQHVVIH